MVFSSSTPCAHITGPPITVESTPRNPACVTEMTQAIDHARAIEGVKKLVLPSNWLRLSAPQQLFVITDIERVDRGFTPYLGMNASLDAAAQTAANRQLDPYPPSSFAVGYSAPGVEGLGGVWDDGPNVLGADYVWLYDDGWTPVAAGRNIDCNSPTDVGCWGHRYELLGWFPQGDLGVGLRCTTCEVGAGVDPSVAGAYGLAESMTVLVVLPAGHPPAMTFTWAKEKPYFNPSTYPPVTTTTTTTTTMTTVPGSLDSTTTTLVDPSTTTTGPLVPPHMVVVTAGRVKAGVVTLAWATSPATAVSSVVLRVYAHPGCKGVVASAATRWKNASRQQGTARVSRPAVLKVGAAYTATLTARNAAGWVISRCVNLGRVVR
jgi:hypothetical protein